MARLIRTEKEVEGRYEEVWLVVEEDALDQWPAGPARRRRPAGDAPRRARSARAARRATPPTSSCPGCSTRPCCARRTRTRACERIDLVARARGARRARRVGPGDVHVLATSRRLPGRSRRRGRAPTRAGQARAALELIDVEWEVLEPLARSRGGRRARRSSLGEPRRYERGDVERGLAEADVVVEASTARRPSSTTRWRRTSRCATGSATTLDVYISTQYIWGVRDDGRRDSSGCRRTRCASSASSWAAASARRTAPATTRSSPPSSRSAPAGRSAARSTRREENLAAGNRNATIQRLSVGARADGTLVALDGEFVNAIGWGGWTAPTDGPMQMLYACDERAARSTYGAKLNTPPMHAFRAPGFVEGTFGLECLLDELAAKLDIDPLELRRRNYARLDPDDRPYSSKNLMECYRRAEPHWERRHEVRARSDGTVEARRRLAVADLVRRRRPALVRVGPRRLRRRARS